MSAKKGDHLKLGLFVLAGSALLVVGLYMLGSKRNLFRNTIGISTNFHNAGGLRPGNNVRYAGINVGTVEGVRIVNDTSVLVTMAIHEEDAAYIRDNAVASLGTDGLIGNKLVNIAPGEGTGSAIGDGTVLNSSVPLDTDQMMRTLDRTNMNMAAITDDLRELSDRLTREGGLVYMLSDSALAMEIHRSITDLQRAVEHVRSATANVDAILADVKAGRGALGLLVSDPATEEQVRDGLGSMHRMADTLAHASSQVDQFAKGLNTPGGLAYTLVRDTASAGDVRRTLARLDTSTVLLNENLRALRSNWFFRGYFKDQEKERRKQEKKAAP